MNNDIGGRRPEQYWPAPLTDSASQAPPELVIPERRLSGRVVIFCVIAGLVVLVPIVTTLVIRGHKDTGPPHTITIPASVDQYERMTGSVADRTVEAMRQAARNDTEDGPAAMDLADNMFDAQGGVTGAREFDPGPFGGVLRCGKASSGTGAMCVWIDASTVGMFVTPDTDIGALARVALDFRGVAEQ